MECRNIFFLKVNKYHTIGTVTKSNRKIRNRKQRKKSIPTNSSNL